MPARAASAPPSTPARGRAGRRAPARTRTTSFRSRRASVPAEPCRRRYSGAWPSRPPTATQSGSCSGGSTNSISTSTSCVAIASVLPTSNSSREASAYESDEEAHHPRLRQRRVPAECKQRRQRDEATDDVQYVRRSERVSVDASRSRASASSCSLSGSNDVSVTYSGRDRRRRRRARRFRPSGGRAP